MLNAYFSLQTYLTGLLGRNDRGATAVEYGLMVALIAVVVAVGATLLGTSVRDLFTTVAGQV